MGRRRACNPNEEKDRERDRSSRSMCVITGTATCGRQLRSSSSDDKNRIKSRASFHDAASLWIYPRDLHGGGIVCPAPTEHSCDHLYVPAELLGLERVRVAVNDDEVRAR